MFGVTLLHFLFCRVTISCPLCEHDVINENEPIRMEAVCPECVGNSLVSYQWKLFFVEGYPTVRHWDSIQCMHPGKSQFELWRKQNTSEVRDWMNRAAGQHMICMQHCSRSNSCTIGLAWTEVLGHSIVSFNFLLLIRSVRWFLFKKGVEMNQ